MSHDHTHKRAFSQVFATKQMQYEGAGDVQDDANTLCARTAFESNPTEQNATALCQALCYQLRYRQALPICLQLVQDYPSNYDHRRRLALIQLKLLQLKECKESFLWCLERTTDLLDVKYRLGLCCYYGGEYAEAKDWFEQSLPLCENRDEMYVAVVYWLELCNIKLGSLGRVPKRAYDCGHHTGYDAFLCYLDEGSEENIQRRIASDTPLNQTCLYYAMYVYFEGKDEQKAVAYLDKMLSIEDWWAGFSAIAGYADFCRRGK